MLVVVGADAVLGDKQGRVGQNVVEPVEHERQPVAAMP